MSTVCEETQDYNKDRSLNSIIDIEESLPPMLNISQSCDGILELESSIMEINIEEVNNINNCCLFICLLFLFISLLFLQVILLPVIVFIIKLDQFLIQ